MLNVQEDEVRKGGGGEEGRLLATYAPDSSSPEKKGANDRRTGFTSFRALFAPLRTMFCRKKVFPLLDRKHRMCPKNSLFLSSETI